MNACIRRLVALYMVPLMLCSGCMHGRRYYFTKPQETAYYKDKATHIEQPDVDACRLDEVRFAGRPITLDNFAHCEFWNLPLEKAVQMALHNSKIIRRIGEAGSVKGTGVAVPSIDGEGTLLLENINSDAIPSVYNPAIQGTSVGIGLAQGVEAALADFDAQLAASMFWEKNDRPVNTNNANLDPFNFQQDRAIFQSQLSKTTATGGTFAARHNVTYDLNNIPTREVASDYFIDLELEARHPLLQGAGPLFNRIAGPGGAVGQYRGVIIARIDNEMTLADFEANVRNMVFNVEKAYWELHFAYRALDAVKRGRDESLKYWRAQEALGREGDEEQARVIYFRLRAQMEWLLSDLLQTERAFRYQLGLTPSDKRLIRPLNEPTVAPVCFDWDEIHCEALARDVSLRQQKWRIKKKEMELVAARNFLLPRLDAVGQYRWVGAGDTLIDPNGFGVGRRPPGFFRGSDAWSTLTDGDYQEWQLGLEFSMPLGFRRELSAVRNAELQLARDRAILQDQELTVSHLLSDAVRKLEDWYHVSKTQFNAWLAARDLFDKLQARFDQPEGPTYGDVQQAFDTLINAEMEYYRSVANYNKEIPHVHYRKGSLLDYNGVVLAEGPWPCKAYHDARLRARERSQATHMDYCLTRPAPFSRGPIVQQPGIDCPPQGPLPGPPVDYHPSEVMEGPAELHGENVSPPLPDAPPPPTNPGGSDDNSAFRRPRVSVKASPANKHILFARQPNPPQRRGAQLKFRAASPR